MALMVGLMRHAHEDKNKITASGVGQIKSVVGQMQKVVFYPDLVLAENTPRIQETASLVVKEFAVLGKKISVREYDDFQVRIPDAVRAARNEDHSILVIGSQPEIMKAASWLVSELEGLAPLHAQVVIVESPDCDH